MEANADIQELVDNTNKTGFMMNFLSSLKMAHKLILMIFIPMVGLLYFSLTDLATSSDMLTKLESLQAQSSLSVKSSALVHELQKERGMSAGYLGAKGSAFSTALINQRKLTDQKITEFIDHLSSTQNDRELGQISLKAIDALKIIQIKRIEVDKLSIDTKSALKYYTDINTSLLNLGAKVATTSTEAEIARLVSAYVSFLQSKERAGIERAVLSNTFAAEKFGAGMFNKFSSLVAKQEAYMDSFLQLASPVEREYFNTQMKGRSIEETNRMRKIAFENAGGKVAGIDATYWFSMQTKKINLLKNVEDWLSDRLNTKAGMLKKNAQTHFFATSMASATGVIITLLLVYFVLVHITRDLKNAVALSNTISKGDLTSKIEVRGNDEFSMLQRAMKEMNDNLYTIVNNISSNSLSIQSSAINITQGNSDLSARTENQASSLEETSSSMEQMTTTVQQNADNANRAKLMANDAQHKAQAGVEVVSRVIAAMSDINESSVKISDIIGVIDEIAFQTNLLALNAAVEAARAGEQGRGFAVVASEVRNLSQRSAGAAKEIKTLINDSVEKVNAGSKLVDESGVTLTEIVDGVKNVSDIVLEIATASYEQSAGINQVNQAIMEMDKMTQQNAALVEEITEASMTMYKQSESLTETAQFFIIDESQNNNALINNSPTHASNDADHEDYARPALATT